MLYYTNLVEFFKFIAKCCAYFTAKSGEDVSIQTLRSYSIFAVDIYQLFKWGILLCFWIGGYTNSISKIVIYYLIYSNLFVYFYYHTWGSKFAQRRDKEALRKNFINYLMAIAFYLCSYAYLYQFHYANMILIDAQYLDIKYLDYVNAIYLSVSTAFTLTYNGFQPLTQEIRNVFLTELINTFLFFTIIISNSIPSNFTEDKNELPQ